MAASSESTHSPGFLPAQMLSVGAVACAWLLPGLGHALLGHSRRALVLFVSIAGLWLGGLLVGGAGVIDPLQPIEEEHRSHDQPPVRQRSLWFYGQIMIAPSLLVYRVQVTRPAPIAPPPEVSGRTDDYITPVFAHGFELGQLFAAVAGLLNLLAMIDLVWRVPASGVEDRASNRRGTGVRRRPLSSLETGSEESTATPTAEAPGNNGPAAASSPDSPPQPSASPAFAMPTTGESR